ncbi:MAG: 3-keto-5-aminohexanoate cleavage protein [Sphingomonadales bacterium]|jgi:uncharacterized protein (DUF849 family)|uniref:3-keto-5-aminohexanoate cleavage protein n=1 Tax=Sphingorhabdus sp. TaxID=1902408 RepID=UPI0039BCF03F|nr:3-keto-5-aminohexanoate cleavage protein [Sphingomonadaceae bacterium]MCE2830376.1 3-keto-5-aminohexanoate cleavage protein [Sphingomonadales bacterium]
MSGINFKTILTCAVTGNLVTPEQNPNLPVTPAEIAYAVIGAAKAGAAIAHIHVRDPHTAKPSMDMTLYREVVERIRDSATDVVINLTTGEGGRFVPGTVNPSLAGPGTTLLPPDARVEHVVELKPELCSLDFNTMWSGRAAVINSPQSIERMADLIQDAGVKPEIEVFESCDIQMALDFIDRGIIRAVGPHFFQVVTGVKYGAAATPAALNYLSSLFPVGALWSAFGVGRHEYPMLANSFLNGGHVRVGMEDNVYISKGELCRDNAQLVTKARQIVELLGGELATPAEARTMLGLA